MDSIRDTKMQSAHETDSASTSIPVATNSEPTSGPAPKKRRINEHFTDLNVMLRMPDLSAVRHLIEDEDKLTKTEIVGVYMNEQAIGKSLPPQ